MNAAQSLRIRSQSSVSRTFLRRETSLFGGDSFQLGHLSQRHHVSRVRVAWRHDTARAALPTHGDGPRVSDDDASLSFEAKNLSAYKQSRIDRLERSRQGGLLHCYPRLFHHEQPVSIPEFRRQYEDKQQFDSDMPAATVYGRIRSKRQHGKFLLFVDVVNEFERLQGLISWKALLGAKVTEEQFNEFLHLIEVGDHISITGMPNRSSTGELTIKATRLPELLAPAVEQIPTKLKDPDTKIRARHLDTIVNPEVADTLRLRAYIIRYLRDFFHEKNFLEFQTPILAENAGGAIARPFTTTTSEVLNRELALRIAPELWLKRLVIGGVHRVFEIGPAFRNEGIDSTHNPEFTMCEFYSAYTNLEDLILQTEGLLTGLAQHCQDLISAKLTSLPPVNLSSMGRPFLRLEFIPALEERLSIRLPNLASETALQDLIAALTAARIPLGDDSPANLPKLLDRLASTYLEPESHDRPLFITHHPACMSPLAKSFPCPTTKQDVSARAELFVHGRELANMYEEENDPVVQRHKLLAYRAGAQSATTTTSQGASSPNGASSQRTVDDALGEAPPVDASYLRALDAGLPPTGGWGCGVERLVMLFSGAQRISDTLSFGSLRNVMGLSSGVKE